MSSFKKGASSRVSGINFDATTRSDPNLILDERAKIYGADDLGRDDVWGMGENWNYCPGDYNLKCKSVFMGYGRRDQDDP